MSRQLARMLIGLCLFLGITCASAANLVIYDDQSENGFNDGCSFPSPSADFNFADTTVVHSGTHSIRFTPDHFNAVSWCTPATYSAATDYTGIDFWVNGGATGGQNVDVVLGLTGNPNPVAFASLTSLNGGNPIPAGAWTHITAPFTSGALAYNGSFDQISLQDESNSVQTDMYFDDVSLIPAAGSASPVQNAIFTDSFEPEYMLVPQYNQGSTGSIKVFQRTANTDTFTLVNTASLPAGAHPNAVSISPDGTVWAVDDGHTQLLHYTLQSILTNANPAQISPAYAVKDGAGGAAGGLYDMAFFGNFGYVASDSGILKFALSDLNAGNGNVPTQFSASLNVPAGLAFDAQGLLWICNNGNNTIVRMDPATGAVDANHINSNSISGPEGLAFDQYGSLWVGNNSSFALPAFADWQLNLANFSAELPIYQITTPSANPHGGQTGETGGLAFDKFGHMWANYEYSLSVLGYSLESLARDGGLPGVKTYTSTALPELGSPAAPATTDPGRGGIAFWPVPSTVHR